MLPNFCAVNYVLCNHIHRTNPKSQIYLGAWFLEYHLLRHWRPCLQPRWYWTRGASGQQRSSSPNLLKLPKSSFRSNAKITKFVNFSQMRKISQNQQNWVVILTHEPIQNLYSCFVISTRSCDEWWSYIQKTRAKFCALCSRLTRERLLSDPQALL